jgi:hypothetical protein
MIDRLRRELREYRAQMSEQTDRVDAALAALGSETPTRRRATPARRSTAVAASGPAASPARKRTSPGKPKARTRAASGETKAAVLGGLSPTEPRTATDVEKLTGVKRGTASTMLHTLSKSGQATKATRGYLLAKPGSTTGAD